MTTNKGTYDVHGCTIPETVDLDIVRSLDEVGSGDGSIGDESGYQRCPGILECSSGVKGVIAMRNGNQATKAVNKIGRVLSSTEQNRHSAPLHSRSDDEMKQLTEHCFLALCSKRQRLVQ